MPASHSKRNTSLAFFTSHERDELKARWGKRSSRLTRDSFLPFASCNLCLCPAEDPVACATKGDIFCRQCILANLLAQKGAMKRAIADAGRRENEREAQAKERERREDEYAVQEFERTQAGLSKQQAASSKGEESSQLQRQQSKRHRDDSNSGERDARGAKAFKFDDAAGSRNAQRDRERARRDLDEEEQRREKLASFWVPSVTPQAQADPVNAESLRKNTICPCSTEGDDEHLLNLKTLVAVQFSHSNGGATKCCPACSKSFAPSSKASLAVPCGHVVCRSCRENFMTPTQSGEDSEDARVSCYVCDADLTPKSSVKEDLPPEDHGKKSKKRREKSNSALIPGLVDIRSQGTGFAGGGTNMVERDGVVFQC